MGSSAGLALLLLGLARAGPPRDYRAELDERGAREVEALAGQGRLDEARGRCKVLRRSRGPSTALLYECAVVENLAGRIDAALAAYDELLTRDPSHAAGRYDRAELRLLKGQLDGAEEDLAVAQTARPDHWAVHLRRTELAGLRGDAPGLEAALLDAVRHGFDLRSLPEYPRFRAFAADARLGPVLERLIVVYGDEETWRALRGS